MSKRNLEKKTQTAYTIAVVAAPASNTDIKVVAPAAAVAAQSPAAAHVLTLRCRINV